MARLSTANRPRPGYAAPGRVRAALSRKPPSFNCLVVTRFPAPKQPGRDHARRRGRQGREGEAPLTITGVTQEGTEYKPFTKTLTPLEAYNYWGAVGGEGDNTNTKMYVYDASFIKLRQLTVGYSFPKKLLTKTPLQNLTLSFVGRNLAILFKNTPNIDPESNYANGNSQGFDYFGFPSTRSYGFNLRATF